MSESRAINEATRIAWSQERQADPERNASAIVWEQIDVLRARNCELADDVAPRPGFRSSKTMQGCDADEFRENSRVLLQLLGFDHFLRHFRP